MNIGLICKECGRRVFFDQVIGYWTHGDGSRVCEGIVIDGVEKMNLRKFEQDLAPLINKYSLEQMSNTPDYILAKYLVNCLDVFTRATVDRHNWISADRSSTDNISR